MAKDDYFVLVYRLLRYLYGCLKAGERSDIVYIQAKGKMVHLGYYKNYDDAVKAREDAEKKYFGEYRRCEGVGVV